MTLPLWKSPKYATYMAAVLLACLILELTFAGRQQSQTFDEADHILAGYRYWKCLDFAANPEHPPMVKLVASIPLLFQKVRTPSPLCGDAAPSTHKDFVDGRDFLYSNNADTILFQTRLFASIFTIALAVLLFQSAKRMFGGGPALLALTLFVFEPNILAHGFLVTTDMGLTCCLYAAVFTFYLYLEKGTRFRLVLVGVLAGTALAAKHSGILVIPVLAAVALTYVASGKMRTPTDNQLPFGKQIINLVAALASIALIACTELWAFYGFRFAARPGGAIFAPPTTDPASGVALKTLASIFAGLLRIHFLPESYLYGVKHVLLSVHRGGPIFVLGKMYPTGRWFYFPFVLLVKSTLGFLLLLILGSATLFFAKNKNRRALSILIVSPLIFLAFCLLSNLDIGIRHILPVYPFVIVLAAVGAWDVGKYRGAKYAVAVLLAFHVISSLASFPNYIPYSNEAFGGTRNTYRVLGESNVDWGQSLKAIKSYVSRNSVKDCWASYLTSADPTYYHLGCKFLPTAVGWVSRDDMSNPEIEGTVLIGASEFDGTEEMDPYAQFRSLAPMEKISGTVLAFHGRFDLPHAFAVSRINRARSASEAGHTTEAIEAARNAVAAAPDQESSHAELARDLAAAHRIEEARTEYQSAIVCARRSPTEYSQREVIELEKELRDLPQQ